MHRRIVHELKRKVDGKGEREEGKGKECGERMEERERLTGRNGRKKGGKKIKRKRGDVGRIKKGGGKKEEGRKRREGEDGRGGTVRKRKKRFALRKRRV
jgi:hypothetical protein